MVMLVEFTLYPFLERSHFIRVQSGSHQSVGTRGWCLLACLLAGSRFAWATILLFVWFKFIPPLLPNPPHLLAASRVIRMTLKVLKCGHTMKVFACVKRQKLLEEKGEVSLRLRLILLFFACMPYEDTCLLAFIESH
jgi:hypothetical protein